MKKLHLICNSHIDPVWQWDWEEGLGTSVSTFLQAAKFTEDYPYVFNHNESILYEYIEETDPELFAEIRKLVKEGKWHIMGGWYLQPDCHLPSAEAFVRQIKLGRRYFEEKFGERPTAAINFDSFGHSVGLVQILKKCGYEGYMVCRPMKEMLDLPDREMIWRGLDGSEVKLARVEDETIYTSGFGNALEDIKRKAAHYAQNEVGVALWGVGNHGGKNSKKDLDDVTEYIATSEFEVVHSTPEAYFADIHPTEVWDHSLWHCLIGSYSSMNSVKKAQTKLDRMLCRTETVCAAAKVLGIYRKNEAAFAEAEKALCSVGFHDIGSGTCVEVGEESALRKSEYALELLTKERDRALFAMMCREKKAGVGEYPLFIFNDQPYEKRAVVEMEFLVPKGFVSETEQYTVTLRQNGEAIPAQVIKEQANINIDRRKRIAALVTMPPLGLARVDVTIEKTPKDKAPVTPEGDIVLKNGDRTVVIGRKSGAIERFTVGGKDLIRESAFLPVMAKDTPDPWGWNLDAIGEDPEPFTLADTKEGPYRGTPNLQIVSDGELFTEVEVLFAKSASTLRALYRVYKNAPEIDVTWDILWNERDRALLLNLPTALSGDFFGQVPFGTEIFPKNGHEYPMQRFAGIGSEAESLTLYNDNSYSFVCKDRPEGAVLSATLLRGSAYCAHPVDDLPLLRENRYIPYIETGRHTFRYRLAYGSRLTAERVAQDFVAPTEAINFFPHGKGESNISGVSLTGGVIALSTFTEEDGDFVLRLVNNSSEERSTVLTFPGTKDTPLTFRPFEAKMLRIRDGAVRETEIWY